jgi:hypothetical protein
MRLAVWLRRCATTGGVQPQDNEDIYTAISIKVVHEQSWKVEQERERLLGIANKLMNSHSDSQQPFALVFDFSAFLVDNLNWNSCIYCRYNLLYYINSTYMKWQSSGCQIKAQNSINSNFHSLCCVRGRLHGRVDPLPLCIVYYFDISITCKASAESTRLAGTEIAHIPCNRFLPSWLGKAGWKPHLYACFNFDYMYK